MDSLDLHQFKANGAGDRQPTRPKRPPRHKAGEWFLKGPIPGKWLVRAAEASGRGLRAGLALWYLAGVKKNRTVKPTWAVWKRLGLPPDGGRHGLAALEQAGLVAVDRHPGRCPVVTILDCPENRPIDD